MPMLVAGNILALAILPQPQLRTATVRSRNLITMRAPPEIVEKLAPTTSGTGTGLASRQEIDAIWDAFERAYGNRDAALTASRKNSQVLLPFLNSPETITGANRALVTLFGKEGARRIVERNPGVLACAPPALPSRPPRLRSPTSRF